MSQKYILIFGIFSLIVAVKCVTLYQIGIYSKCSGRDNRSQLNIDTVLVSDFYRDAIPQLRHLEYNGRIPYEFVYEEYDVCDSITYLTEIIQNLTLGERYMNQFGNKNYSVSLIIDIFVHASNEMTSIFKSTFQQIPIYDIDYGLQTHDYDTSYDITTVSTRTLVALVKYFRWKKITLVTLTKNDYPFMVYYRKSVEALKNLNICLALYHIEPYQVNNEVGFLKRMVDSDEFSVVVIFGYPENLQEFLFYVEYSFGVIPFFPIAHAEDASFSFIAL